MTQTVTGPDGVKHTFPDEATPEQMKAAMAKLYASQPKPAPETTGELARGIGRSVEQGLTLGAADEAHAAGKGLRAAFDQTVDAAKGGVRSLLDLLGTEGALVDTYHKGYKDQGYDAALEERRTAEDQFRQRHPYLAPALEIGSGILLPGASIAKAPTLAGKVAQGAKVGGATGAASGFLSGEGTADRLTGAGIGAAVGAPLGGALGAGAHGLQRAFQTPENASRRAATAKVSQNLQRDQLKAEDLARGAQEAGGKPVVAADLGGENTLALARGAANAPGETRAYAPEFLHGRAQGPVPTAPDRPPGSVERIVTDLADAMEVKQGYFETRDTLLARRAAEAEPAYKQAFANSRPVDLREPLAYIQQEMAFAKGEIRNVLAKTLTYFTTPDGEMDTSLQGLHQAKLALDDLISGRSETSIGNNAKFRLVEVKKRLLQAMDEASVVDGERGPVSLYARARNNFSGDSLALDRLEDGRNALMGKKGMSIPEIRALPASEREFFKIGFLEAIEDSLSGKTDTSDVAKFLRETRKGRELLATVLDGDQNKFLQIWRALGTEQKMARTQSKLAGGSDTAWKLQDQRDFGNVPSAAFTVMRNPADPINWMQLFSSTARRHDPRISEKMANEVGPMLLKPEMLQPTIAALRKFEEEQLHLAGKRWGLADMLTRGGAMAPAQTRKKAR